MNLIRRIVTGVLALIVVTIGPVLAEDEEPPPVYELRLVYLDDGPETEFIFVIGNSGFRSVASLKDFLASRPAGTTLRWAPGCIRMGREPLLSSEADMEEFQAFCLEHSIVFELVPSG
jgi:hypothetical protein